MAFIFGEKCGGMRACRHTQCLAENDIIPQDFTSSVTS